MVELNKNELQALYEEEQNFTAIGKRYCEAKGVEYTDNIRRRISNILRNNKLEVDADLENDTVTDTNQYSNDKEPTSFMPSAWDKDLNRFLTIDEFCDKYGLDKKSVRSSKIITHNPGHITYNIAFYTPEEESALNIDEHLEEIVSKHIKPLSVSAFLPTNSASVNYFDRLVYTDVHIAMDVQGYGDPLYDGKWDREEILSRLNAMIEHTIRYQRGNTLYIDELGDFLDGLGGETTRKGHKLPQNMNDKEAFELALEFKIHLVERLLPYYDKIICNMVTNDNHAGVFGYFAASSVKKILEAKYPEKVAVNVLKRFMEHYSVGKHTFICVHGKDMGEQKFGMKPKLDAVLAEKIDQYCKEHSLYNGNYIELSKGDSHQAIYDDTTSNDFSYYNYPAFSPPSNWVKTNFKLSKSGFRLYNIHLEENIKIAIPYYF